METYTTNMDGILESLSCSDVRQDTLNDLVDKRFIGIHHYIPITLEELINSDFTINNISMQEAGYWEATLEDIYMEKEAVADVFMKDATRWLCVKVKGDLTMKTSTVEVYEKGRKGEMMKSERLNAAKVSKSEYIE